MKLSCCGNSNNGPLLNQNKFDAGSVFTLVTELAG